MKYGVMNGECEVKRCECGVEMMFEYSKLRMNQTQVAQR